MLECLIRGHIDGIFCFYVQSFISYQFGFGIQSHLKHDYLGDVNLAFFTSFGVVEGRQHACSPQMIAFFLCQISGKNLFGILNFVDFLAFSYLFVLWFAEPPLENKRIKYHVEVNNSLLLNDQTLRVAYACFIIIYLFSFPLNQSFADTEWS